MSSTILRTVKILLHRDARDLRWHAWYVTSHPFIFDMGIECSLGIYVHLYLWSRDLGKRLIPQAGLMSVKYVGASLWNYFAVVYWNNYCSQFFFSRWSFSRYFLPSQSLKFEIGNDHFTHQHEEEEGDMMEKKFCLPNLAQPISRWVVRIPLLNYNFLCCSEIWGCRQAGRVISLILCVSMTTPGSLSQFQVVKNESNVGRVSITFLNWQSRQCRAWILDI